MSDTAARLRDRAQTLGIPLPAGAEARLVAYFDLLVRWNAKINLTASTDTDSAIDRLLMEPIAAAAELPRDLDLIDLGSGGGSPGIPLALVLDARRLVMVESKSRKAAFLREAVRVLELKAVVECDRFESIAALGAYARQMSAVSIRAVRVDRPTMAVAKTFLTSQGLIALFTTLQSLPSDGPYEALQPVKTTALPGDAHLLILKSSADVPQ
jgi:16S rRNA (guanine527-N7)-methyltransferase